MEWSIETYRLDEVENKFPLPCVIQVNEGYYSETDAEGFSCGDILSIDKKVTLHKIAANFAYESPSTVRSHDKDYVDLVEREILVPLNYRGKLKVLRQVTNYDSVRELAKDFPRYAVLRDNLKARTEENKLIEITAGTVLELDRVIPGSTYGPKAGTDNLVVLFSHSGKDMCVALPFTDSGKFRTEPDENKYTIKEAIDRYDLPQHVKFVDDEIKRVYTQDLMEGLANMKTITATLRLNRLLTQSVLVGHYKPIDEAPPDDCETRQRTLVVIPLDNKEIREIEVNVLQGATEQDYETIFRVRNTSNTDELIDGSLYVDFAMSTPGIKRIAHKPFSSQPSEDEPPPLPPRPRNGKTAPPETLQIPTDYDDYIIPEPARPPNVRAPNPGLGFSLAEFDFSAKPIKAVEPKKKIKKKQKKAKPLKGIESPKQAMPPTSPLEEDPYEIMDENILPKPPHRMNPGSEYKQLPYPRPCVPSQADKPRPLPETPLGKQIARVSPATRDQQTTKKLFKDLNCDELVARLKYCGLSDFAKTCEDERLNGAFFENLSVDTLKSTLDLKGIQLAKFIQMRDENWVPS